MAGEQKPQTVLLVDPSPDVHELVESRLRTEGLRVLHAYDGATAGALLAQSLPDVILMELDLPGLRGLDVVRQLRADPAYARIPVIVMTANPDPMLQMQVPAAG